MRRARCVFGIAWNIAADAEPITVRNRNRHPGGNSVPIADRYTNGNPNADLLANPERRANRKPDALRCDLGGQARPHVGLQDHMRRPR